MGKSILYRRWDNRVFEIEFDQTSSAVCTITKVTPNKTCTYAAVKNAFSYSEIEFLLHKDPYGVDLDYVKLKKGTAEYWFDRKPFLYQIELDCLPDQKPLDAIMVANIKDYMNVIQYYRYVALATRIESLLDRLTQMGSENIKIVAVSTKKEIKDDLKIRKIAYTITTQFNKKVLDSAVQELKKIIDNGIGEYERSQNLSSEEARVCTGIKDSFMLYENGENFLYYRGVGHIVYPELPGSLRGNNRRFEDQYYKLAKMSHPDELANLTYLDRIAKIQHYGWPSRLLDVTSNPLVALYMACNTIYSKDDPQQKDLGEIIIYFRNELREKAYDSRTVLTAAALVKLTYQERKAMYEFINMHSKYFMYESEQIGIAEEKLRTVLNFCVRIAAQRGCDTILTETEAQQISICVDNRKISFEKCAHPVDYIYRCIQGQTGRQIIKKHGKGEDQRMRYYNTQADSADKKTIYPYVYTEALDKVQYTQLFEYFVVAFDHLLVTIRRENGAFKNKIDIFSMLRSYHVRLGASNDRILAQSGSFIISGLDDVYINEKMLSSRSDQYVRIIVENKEAMFEELKLLNINDSTVFPDLQNTGNYVRKMFD